MKQFNIPHRYKPLGWFIFGISTFLGILYLINTDLLPRWEVNFPAVLSNEFFGNTTFFTLAVTDLTTLLTAIGIIIGGIMVGFSQEKVDDEYLNQIRLKGLQYAFLTHCILLIFSLLFVREMALLMVMMLNIFVMVILFVIITQVLLYRIQKSMGHVE
jgi:hypothetical protein